MIITVFCIISAVVCRITEKENKELRLLIILGAVSVIGLKCLESISSAFVQIKAMTEAADIDEGYVRILFKGLGICCITQIACDFCRDCGENSIGGQALLAGKIALLIISFPLFGAVADIVKTLVA